MLLGSGELGRELTISLKRLGCHVVACDKYDNAPAMQVADDKLVFDMLDADKLDYFINIVKPDLVVPEIEAIATDKLKDRQKKDKLTVVPNADTVAKTMNRDQIRDFVDDLGVRTAEFAYAESSDELREHYDNMNYKVVVKPIMSSSGKGQSVVEADDHVALESAWHYALENMRGDQPKVIIEEYIDFDYELTILTVKTEDQGTLFCPAILHRQANGDFYYSEQMLDIPAQVELKARQVAQEVTDALKGYGLFGVEVFVKGNDVIFSELSPRPHDTGLVTLLTQNLSEFDLHARAILNLPIPAIESIQQGSCMTINAAFEGSYKVTGVDHALQINGVHVHLFNKDKAYKGRRLGIILAPTEQICEAAHQRITVEEV